MKNISKIIGIVLLTGLLFDCEPNNMDVVSDSNLESLKINTNNPFLSGTWVQEDQMGRPAINTVFVSTDSKDLFNTTIPSEQNAAFQAMFEANLIALSPAYDVPADKNALGWDAATFSGALATDVLTVSLDGETTFFNPVTGALLTGRALADDVITVELLLIFGGEDFTENPALSDDHVDANDTAFLSAFPYLANPW